MQAFLSTGLPVTAQRTCPWSWPCLSWTCQDLDIGFPPVKQWVHRVRMWEGTETVLQCSVESKIWFHMFTFPSFKCSSDVSANICHGRAFWKQSSCWSAVPKSGRQWKQTWCSKSQFLFFFFFQESCRRACALPGLEENSFLRVPCLFAQGAQLRASPNPGRSPRYFSWEWCGQGEWMSLSFSRLSFYRVTPQGEMKEALAAQAQ